MTNACGRDVLGEVKSSKTPTRVASTRPHPSRKGPDRASLPKHLRGADLDGATVACCWAASGHLDGRVQVVGVESELILDGSVSVDA
jgi:hypothetical protein